MDSNIRPLLNHGAQNGTELSRSGLTNAESHGVVASLDLYPIFLLIWPEIALAFLALMSVTLLTRNILKLWSTHTHEFPCTTLKPVHPYSVLTLLIFFKKKRKREKKTQSFKCRDI